MRWESLMSELGRPAADFTLPDPSGTLHTPGEIRGPRGLLVAFICNHCPYVLHIIDGFSSLASELAPLGIGTVAISSNDVDAHPEDGPAFMAEYARVHAFRFPYLFDESQSVAKAYDAACTPDLFLYDADLRLFYRGRFDASRPKTPHTDPIAVTAPGADLRQAARRLMNGDPPPPDQRPSMGCSMKWKPGNEPPWA